MWIASSNLSAKKDPVQHPTVEFGRNVKKTWNSHEFTSNSTHRGRFKMLVKGQGFILGLPPTKDSSHHKDYEAWESQPKPSFSTEHPGWGGRSKVYPI